MKQLFECFKMLRQDALERGMPELAVAYGWSTISFGSRAALGE